MEGSRSETRPAGTAHGCDDAAPGRAARREAARAGGIHADVPGTGAAIVCCAAGHPECSGGAANYRGIHKHVSGAGCSTIVCSSASFAAAAGWRIHTDVPGAGTAIVHRAPGQAGRSSASFAAASGWGVHTDVPGTRAAGIARAAGSAAEAGRRIHAHVPGAAGIRRAALPARHIGR
jgi:hypothetical protein